ncbi:Nuclear mitotic apparatus protein 1 [Collichthys lucidus]|uniref:Nuclear mitotic apparatus protein 1 n=1 Tax=Collichthys lucidus TaxID=240159 RepID=A0A4U5V478_COLLU|nr:Nuclear mitotic apparatus protein 1 [Collichthys lucidus]
MAMNLGVKALLGWVNSIKLSDREIRIDDLQDGTHLLKVVYMLKKEPTPCSSGIEDRFKLIRDFVERDCRFSSTQGTLLSWDNIRDGINLTVEIAKVLLCLIYHDLMNERSTVHMLKIDEEREIATLTGSYVMESEDSVYLSSNLDSYLARRHLPVAREIFEQSATTSSSSVSSMSPLSDDSPVFHRTQKITFVDMQTVASSSVSKSPLQDIMNTPKFQMRKMQRQMIKDRDYRDGLERELASKLTLIAQRETCINQLQYRLDKLKEEHTDEEQVIREQINELETKNNTLQMRFNEMLKQNKDLKSTSSLMERKVDELTDENGALSSQMRAVCSQLAIFEAEVGRLTENQASAQEEWTSKINHLESELNKATALKELLTEQIQILQGKISCLEDELSRASMEEVGENMGPVIEREMFETEINSLKNKLESTVSSLKIAEVEIETKKQHLAEYQEEMNKQMDLLKQQKSQAEEMIQAKDEILDKLQKEIRGHSKNRIVACEEEVQKLNKDIQEKNEQLVVLKNDSSRQAESLEQEIKGLKDQLDRLSDSLRKAEEQVQAQQVILTKQEQESAQQTELHQQQLSASEEKQEIESLNKQIKSMSISLDLAKEQVQAKEDLMSEQERTLQIEELKKHSAGLEEDIYRLKEEIQSKEGEVNLLKAENCKESEVLQNEIQTLKDQVQSLNESLKTVTEQVTASEEEIRELREQIQAKEEQLTTLQKDGSMNSEMLQKDITCLKNQLSNMTDSLAKAEDKVQTQLVMLTKQEQESTHQKELLQQQLSSSEEELRKMKVEIQAKEEQITLLKTGSAKQSEILHQDIQDLKIQVECLSSSLREAEDTLQSKESLFAEQQLQSTQDMEALQMQMVASQDEVKRLNAAIDTKEEQLILLKTETSTHSESLQQEIESLNKQIKSMSTSLELAKEQVQAKEDLIAKQEQERTLQIEELRKHSAVLEEDIRQLKEEIQTKEGEVNLLKAENCKESEVLQNEIQTLKDQVQSLNESLKTVTEQVQVKENLLTQKEMQISQEKDQFQILMTTSEGKIRELREQIQTKEEQLTTLQKDGSMNSEMLQKDITGLKNQLSNMTESLAKAEDKVQTQLVMLTKQEQESTHQKELLQQQLSASEGEVRKLKEEIQAKEEQITLLKADSAKQSEILHQEIQDLKRQVEALGSSLREAEEDMQSKEDLLAQQKQENTQQREALQSLQEKVKQVEILQKQIHSQEEEIQKVKESQSDKDGLLLKAEEKLQMLQTELSAANTLVADKDQIMNTLREEVATQANLVQKAKEEAEVNDKMLAQIKEENSKQTDVFQHEIQNLKEEVERISLNLLAKEQMLLQTQMESAQQMDHLQQQLVTVNAQTQAAQELQVATFKEKEALLQEKEVLMARILQVEKDWSALEKRQEALVYEKDRLAQANQAIERENLASHKLESVLQQELETLKMEKEKLLKGREKAEQIEILKRDLQEQLSAKSEAVEHYKAQMEKAVSHYNSKKQLLQESQEEVAELKQSLEVKDREVKAITIENKMLQLDLDKAQTNEKRLVNMVASLEAQLAFADRNLRAQNKINGNERSTTESCYLEVPSTHSSVHTRAQVKRSMSSDSLDQSSLEDSLNSTRKLSAPDESSTPLVRSSERLAAKRRGLQAESLETLYFTPISSRQMNRTITENNMDLDSARKNPTSSVKRRRTTQVINITMTKKTPGGGEGDDTFYSMTSARSHPNLPSAHSTRPVSMELFDTPVRTSGTAGDQLVGLPGYRRSTIHSQPTSTFCVGAENEPDGAPEDWMRIAELQARNKACPLHLKSSYPIESETVRNSAFFLTDEELRMGDPSDTIRRASMMPSQLQDSLASRRHSLMIGHTGAAAGTRSHRMSLMPGQLPSKTVSTQLKSPKGTKRSSSTLSVHQTSPEAERRQSMMFTVENTPKNSNYLKKGLNKLRSSTRKSPGKSSKKSPAQTFAHRSQENIPSGNSRPGMGRAGKIGGFKSPQEMTKAQRKSPRATSRTAKSPGLTSSARKMMRRMKV